MKYSVVLTTAPTLKEARSIASKLLKKKLAACISVTSKIESHYTWKKKIQKGNEYLLIIKTRASHFSKLEKLIKKNHSYSLPEIIMLPIVRGSKEYLSWMGEETT